MICRTGRLPSIDGVDGAARTDLGQDPGAGRPDLVPGPLPPPVPDRRGLLLGLARTTITVAGVIVLYYVLPLDRPFGGRTAVALVSGLVAVGLVVAYQVRAILRSGKPTLRAIQAVALSLPLFLLLFAVIYQFLSSSDPGSFSEPMTRTDGLYFVVTVFSTVGFGDIAPVTEVARVVTTVQMVGDLVLIGVVLRVFVAAADRGRRRAADRNRPPNDV